MSGGPLRGFRDYVPPDAGARSELRRRLRGAARRSGFQELEVPSVESFELYQTKSGAGIAAETWTFRDKGDRPVALVPEQTPSLARIFADRAKAEPLPVKWFTVAKSWRYEEPQSGRTREFVQFNLDILGVPGVAAEADLLATAALALDDAGAAGLYRFRINDRAIAEGIGRRFGATEPERLFRAIDRFRKVGPEEFEKELAGAGVDPARTGELRTLLASAGEGIEPARLDGYLGRLSAEGVDPSADPGLARVRELTGLLVAMGLGGRIVFDPTIVRGLAYYTSTVFEAFATVGEARALFGGGRYDHLIELFGGPPTPAAGLALGDQTLEILLRAAGRWPEGEPALDTYVVTVRPELLGEALGIVEALRRNGTTAEADLLGRSMSRQLREAARRRCRRALILGLKEASPGALVERDLATGTQREIAREPARGPA